MTTLYRLGSSMRHGHIFAGELSSLAIDDLHQVGLGEFENDPEAVARLTRAYEEGRQGYLLALYTLRAERAQREETS